MQQQYILAQTIETWLTSLRPNDEEKGLSAFRLGADSFCVRFGVDFWAWIVMLRLFFQSIVSFRL